MMTRKILQQKCLMFIPSLLSYQQQGKDIFYPEKSQAMPWAGITFHLNCHPDHSENYKELYIPKCDAHPCPHTVHFHSPGWPELALLQASLLSSWNPSQASHPVGGSSQSRQAILTTQKVLFCTQHWYCPFCCLFLQLKSTQDNVCERSSSQP